MLQTQNNKQRTSWPHVAAIVGHAASHGAVTPSALSTACAQAQSLAASQPAAAAAQRELLQAQSNI
jgi:hypothetical protein